MIKYLIYQKNPESHYIDIDLIIDNINSEKLQLQLSSWRPGRYELGNFAKNIKRVEAFNDNAVSLKYVKQNKDLWEIDTKNCSTIKVTYSYYAAELNAGSCFADSSQLYLNPIHCCMFVVGRTDEVHQLELNIPSDYKIVCSLKQEGTILTAENYDELVDSPLIASANIQSDFYTVDDIKFYLHFNGECKPNFEKIKKDFIAFSKKQIDFWKDCPTKEYHFLFQILPFKFYHGVEHLKSTVIAIGPGYAINEGLTYEDILGVSCHELFHTWNI
jgi:predicted metalloprotease with PDZ domain